MKKFPITLISILFALTLTFQAQAQELSGPAPNFALKTIDGKTARLSDYKGQVVMLNFWASWCGPCREEMPLLEKIYTTYKKAGFVLLGVTIDEKVADAKGFLSKSPVSFPILLDSQGKTADLYNNRAMPSSYFIDRKGNLAYLHKGYRPGDEKNYKAVIRKLIAM